VLPKVLVDDNFLEVSSARRLMDISGTIRAINWKFSKVKNMGLYV
jgi:FtsZ-interacting cell division protein YlmF